MSLALAEDQRACPECGELPCACDEKHSEMLQMFGACPECGELPCACDEKQKHSEMLQLFGARLQRLLDETVGKRYSIEERWLRDIRQYHGQYEPDELTKIKAANGSQVFTNITRNKANAAEARLSDMLFPTDDRNWGIQPTPKPDMQIAEEALQGQPIQEANLDALAQEVRRVKDIASDKAENMTRLIEDQLTESSYDTQARDVIHDAIILGTGVVKGPVVVTKENRQWSKMDGISVLKMERTYEPAVERVDPWDFFPDMSATDASEAEFFFERRRMTKRQMREYAKTPGVLVDQIQEVLGGEAKHQNTVTRDHINDIREITGVDSIAAQSRYEMWEYHGPISKDDLIAAGVDDLDEEDNLTEYEGTVHLVNGVVTKVQINHLDTGDHPYSVFNWEEDESSIFGFGVPYQMRSEQRMCNASIRMLLDNAGLSVGDQIVIDHKKIMPADGSWKLGPRKVWFKTDEEAPINDAFATFRIDSHQVELQNIFTLGRQLADEVTNLPLIAQGEQAEHVTQTAQGMGMLMNSANIVMRKAVKNWDDNITRPLIRRMYDHNMQYSDDESVKGDFNIDARGTSALLVKETQARNVQAITEMAMANPEYGQRTDWEELWRKTIRSHQLDDDVILSEEEQQKNAENAQQQPPPEVQKAQMEAELKKQQMQIDAQASQQKIQADMQMQRERLAQEREIKMAEIAIKQDLTMAELQAKLQLEKYRENNKRDIAAAKTTNEQAKMQLQHRNLTQGYDTF